jgi:hypothetical protein
MADFREVRERRVTAREIQDAFNSGQFYQRLRTGDLTARPHNYNRHLSRRSARALGERYCVRSLLLSYYDADGQKIAVVHLYRRPDGALGASGQHDPKWLRVGTEILISE